MENMLNNLNIFILGKQVSEVVVLFRPCVITLRKSIFIMEISLQIFIQRRL